MTARLDYRTARRIGFLADTHSRKADGSDLPQQVLDAFAGADLIVHLGDIGQKGILGRLTAIAPVLVPAGGGKGWIPVGHSDSAPIHVIDASGRSVGLTFDLSKPDNAITLGERAIEFAKPLEDLMKKRFGRRVDAIAFGGTHRQRAEEHDGVVFFDPGSPTIPSDKRGPDDLGSVSVLQLDAGKIRVEEIRINRVRSTTAN